LPIYKEAFEVSLGIKDPWHIKNIVLNSQLNKLDVFIDFERGSKFSCPICGKPGCPAYDTRERDWHHVNFFQNETYLHCRVPRVECIDCGIHVIQVPWAREQSSLTLEMEAMILKLAEKMPVLKASELVGEYDTKLWRVIHHYVNEARAKEDFSDVSKIGVDETSRKKGHNYITIVADLDSSKVLFVCEGKDSSTITKFSKDLQNHNGDPSNIQHACCDMSPSFISGISEQFPNAMITFDKFHVMKIMNEGVDEVRKQETKKKEELKGTKYLWLKNEENLSKKQKEKFSKLKNRKLKTVKAYNIKKKLQELWNLSNREEAGQQLKKWYFWATHSRLNPYPL